MSNTLRFTIFRWHFQTRASKFPPPSKTARIKQNDTVDGLHLYANHYLWVGGRVVAEAAVDQRRVEMRRRAVRESGEYRQRCALALQQPVVMETHVAQSDNGGMRWRVGGNGDGAWVWRLVARYITLPEYHRVVTRACDDDNNNNIIIIIILLLLLLL